MTKQVIRQTPFGAWLHNQERLHSVARRLSTPDIDFCIHRYRETKYAYGLRDETLDHILMLEVKSYGYDMPFAQRDSFALLEACTASAWRLKNGVRRIEVWLDNRTRIVKFHGFFVLKLRGATPKDGPMSWGVKLNPARSDGFQWQSISEEELVEVLDFQRDPWTLKKRNMDKVHEPATRKQRHPRLMLTTNPKDQGSLL